MDVTVQFERLDAWLARHQTLWRANPFTDHRLSWEAEHPALARFLRSRSLAQAEAVHNAPALLQAPAPFAELAHASLAFSRLPDWSTDLAPVDERLSRHIPGRKWEQINRFAQAALSQLPNPAEHWLDWCAGKGHLGRLLAARSGAPTICLEQDDRLNEAGRALSQACGVQTEHRQADVLAPASWKHLTPSLTPVALHACGQLHMTLLEQAASRGCAQLVISPCCYNRIPTAEYRPLSARARQSRLQLTREDLSLPLQEAVTAGARTRRLRDQSMAWRLAFDLWQREARGVDAYLPTPSRPESALAGGIEAFCHSFAEHHGLQMQPPASWAELEQAGWASLANVRNLELVAALFRRPLEIWLLLDRALFMQEQGYRVRLGQFCAPQLTPRNLLLIASRY